MRRTIMLLLLLAGAAWIAPPQLEDAQGQCQALNALVLRIQARQSPESADDAGTALAVSRRVAEYARRHHPDWPAGLACFAVYWEFAFDGDLSLFQSDAP
jgi:hypothetical protein